MDGFLILGNSVAAAQAAWDLAEAGLPVFVASETPWFAAPDGDLQARAWLLQVSRHPNIRFLAPASVEALERKGTSYRAVLRVGSRLVDAERCTACGECEKVCPVNAPGAAHRVIWRLKDGVPDVFAIERAGKPPCSDTCPGGIHVQGYVALIAQGRFEEALDVIRDAIPFAAVCGRVCDHPCEANCRRNDVDSAVSTRALKRFAADYELKGGHLPSLAKKREKGDDRGQGRKVAVIGSGPAGLTVAAELACMGYNVTIFEALPVAGGMLAVGIPSYRLPKDVLRMEIAAIEALGVEIRLNSPVQFEEGKGLDALSAQGYEAVFIAVGAHKSVELGVPGEDLEGVVHGARLLKMLNLSQQVDDPQWHAGLEKTLVRGADTRVAVIGGGNTAMDVSRSLRRLGVKDVTVLYRRSREEMPAIPEEVEEAEKEGTPFQFLAAPIRVLEKDGRVAGLECVRMRLGEPDRSGRPRPVPIPGSEFRLDVDLVVPAIGQSPELSFLGEAHGLEITQQGTFEVSRATYMTNRPGVFAAGDAITQPVSVIHAIQSAKQAAASIDAYLRGAPYDVAEDEAPVSHRELSDADRQPRPRNRVPAIPMAERLTTFEEVELGFDEAMAVAEASRCLACGPCSECLACVTVCEPHAIRHDWREERMELSVAGVLHSGGGSHAAKPQAWEPALLANSDLPGVIEVAPDDRLAASAAAARMMALAIGWPRRQVEALRRRAVAEAPRVGVWLCACEGQISDRLPLESVLERADALGGVVWTGRVDQACAPEAAAQLAQAVREHGLNRVVVGACSCCALDQVCYSCTTQRLRCKAGLMSLVGAGAWLEFVNIREQCAWLHDNPAEAASAARSLVAAGVARARFGGLAAYFAEHPAMPSAVVVGSGSTAGEMAALLARIGLAVSWADSDDGDGAGVPGVTRLAGQRLEKTEGSLGDVRVTLRGKDGVRTATAGAVVIVGGQEGGNPSRGQISGLYQVEVGASPAFLEATAAKLGVLLGRTTIRTDGSISAVSEDLCRACGTCAAVCPFEAVEITQAGGRRAARVTAGRCEGCGLCVARCPSGAMTLGAASDAEIEMALQALCQGWE